MESQLDDRVRAATRTWLVTGVAGFIGSHLLEKLLLLGQRVVGLDNFATGSRENLEEVRDIVEEEKWSNFEFVEGDIRDLRTCHRVCRGIDFVLHEAALGSVPRSIDDPLTTNSTNIDGFVNMLIAARDAGVSRFVYAASSSTYGDSEILPKREDRVGKPLSPYAVTKLVNELYASVFARVYGLQVIGLRYFNVFGPRQDPHGPYAAVIPRWVAALLNREPCVIYGDGETTRDFCYVANVVQANLLAALVASPDAVDEVYNVAVGGRTSLNETYAAIREVVARCCPGQAAVIRSLEPEHRPARKGDVRHSQADISKAAGLLRYKPTHDFRAGIDAAAAWYVARFSQHGVTLRG